MSKLKTLSLFSGVGAADLGLEATEGFETIAMCEIDTACQEVLKKHWPNVPMFEDVKQVSYHNGQLLESYSDFVGMKSHECSIDVVTSSFPCTDISVAGKKKGLIDKDTGEITRSGLWFETKRLVAEIRPKYLIVENVPNLLNLGMWQVLSDLDELGYNAEWQVISARDFGAPHLRKRIWIVAYPNPKHTGVNIPCPTPVKHPKLPKNGAMINGVILTLDEGDWNLETMKSSQESLPTPTTQDWKYEGEPEKMAHYAKKSRLWPVLSQRSLPTPTTFDSAEKPLPPRKFHPGGGQAPGLLSTIGKKLNPQFVEWMMGLPFNHTQTPTELKLLKKLKELENSLKSAESGELSNSETA